MFDGIAPSYDLLNRLISLGMDQRWRRKAIASLRLFELVRSEPLTSGSAGAAASLAQAGGAGAAAPTAQAGRTGATAAPAQAGDAGAAGPTAQAGRAGAAAQVQAGGAGSASWTAPEVLDLGCGTGDFARLVGPAGRVTGVDLSTDMLRHARQRLGRQARLVQASAFELPFPDGAFDGALSGFVLRNLNDLEGAMAELARVLKPGAPIALLDATEPPPGLQKRLFELYFGAVAPSLGALFGKRQAYTYLRNSLAQIPPAPEVCRLLVEAGFEQPSARPLSMGAVTLFTAHRKGG